jgi:hypothetical protein
MRVGEPAFDSNVNVMPDAGRLCFGCKVTYPDGLLSLRQEGFAFKFEEGSLAMYPVPATQGGAVYRALW